MEPELVYELETNITELTPVITSTGTVRKIYPTNAPETTDKTKPYLVYALAGGNELKTLDGYIGKTEANYVFSCMAVKYGDMKSLTNKVYALLKTLPKTSIGATNELYIEDLTIKLPAETWEPELKVNRGVIDFTIYY